MSDIPWTEVEVGNVIMVRDDELFPADLMCLYSNLAENVCFIKVGGRWEGGGWLPRLQRIASALPSRPAAAVCHLCVLRQCLPLAARMAC